MPAAAAAPVQQAIPVYEPFEEEEKKRVIVDVKLNPAVVMPQ